MEKFREILLLLTLFVFMPAVILMALMWVPPAEFLGQASRILYFHVPVAWLSVISFIIAGYNSAMILISKKDIERKEFRAYNSALAGTFFTVLAIITGSVWAKISWGSYWNWDPRETSIVILMLIYISYFSLYSALKDNPGRPGICSVYLIIAMVTMPFFVFVIPRVYPSLHPDTIINAQQKIYLDASMKLTLFASVIVFTILYGYILNIMNRISSLELKTEEKINAN